MPVAEHTELYSAIHRTLERPRVGPKAVARWASGSESNQDMLRFLQDWVADTPSGKWLCHERPARNISNYNSALCCWITKLDLYTRLGGGRTTAARLKR